MKRPSLAAFAPSSRQCRSSSSRRSDQQGRREFFHNPSTLASWSSQSKSQPVFHGQYNHLASSSTTSLSLFKPTSSAAMFFHSSTTTQARASTTTTLATSSTAVSTSSAILDSAMSILTSPGGIVTSVVGIVSLMVYWRYQGAIRQRLKQVREESWLFGAGVTMVRGDANTATNIFPNLQLLQVNPEFQKTQAKKGWKIVGLGDYLSTLRPKQLPKNFSSKDLPKLVQQELEAGLASGLLKALGPNLGRALLPAVGFGPIQGQAQKLGSKLATRWILSKKVANTLGEQDDRAGLPISILSVLALSENNAKLNGGNSSKSKDADDVSSKTSGLDEKLPGTNLSSIQKMKNGENVNGPTFDENLVPRTGFVLTKDFHSTIQRMEQLMVEQGQCGDHSSTELQTAQAELEEDHNTVEDKKISNPDNSVANLPAYDPNDRSMGDPVPINPRLFPDLHLGYGDAKCSHTKRQVLQMRLIAVLLNRLGANYHRMASNDSDDESGDSLFTMQLHADGPTITKPTDLIEGLIDMGQDLTIVPTSRITSFGLGMCIKESDGSWSNIPLGVFLESGYEDENGNMAPAMMPHSGLRLIIGNGPLTDRQGDEYDDFDESAVSNPLIIQHFIGIEGFCGWKPDQNPEVPFNENVESGRPLKEAPETVRAIRLAALYATVLNGLATELELPFGGYGVTAVCNDSAAIIQQCLYGETYIFPLTSIGRYIQRTLRYSQNLDRQFRELSDDIPSMQDELQDLEALMEAMMVLPSDINSTPANAVDAARRLLHTMQPQRPLALMNDSKNIMESILQEHERNKKAGTLSPPSLETKSTTPVQ